MYFLQQIIDGLSTGSIYAALALALVLVHRATGMINFGQGAMGVFCAYVAWALWTAGLTASLAILGAVVAAFFLGCATEAAVIRRFERGPTVTAVVATVGLLIAFEGVSSAIWGSVPKSFPSPIPDAKVSLAGATVGVRALATVGILVVIVVLLQLLFLRTKLGLALRAVADNPQSSALSGLPTERLLMVGWGLAAALGALAACLIAPKVYLSPTMMDSVLIYAVAAAVLGGLDSPIGAVLAAWLIGVIENLAGAYVGFIGDDLKVAVPLVALLLTLLIKPEGIFGRAEAARV